MTASKIQIGATVTGKFGKGTISLIITKSTGYVQVTWESGKVSKEMAFNLTDESGESMKAKPAGKTAEQKLHEKLSVTAHSNGFFVREDGTTDYEGREKFLAEREAKKWGSVSW